MWHPISLKDGIDARIAGNRFERIFHEFIYNSAHLPFAIVLVELLTHQGSGLLGYHFICCAALGAIVQAWFLGSWEFQGRPLPLPGNLIGPTVVTATAMLFEGPHFIVERPQYQLYWLFALLVGLAQETRIRVSAETIKHGAILAENVLRATFVLVLFGLVRVMHRGLPLDLAAYFREPQHLFVFSVIPLFGALNGLSDINAFRYLTVLRETARELRRFSEWFLGPELLRESVGHPEQLELRRAERAVLFMDIRQFTRWSNRQAPEAVVRLVNAYYQAAESALARFRPLKVEFTGDEVFAVFEMPLQAARAALSAIRAVETPLAEVGLGAGAAVNCGSMVEGLLGSSNLKKYTVIGDAVNCAKHICDQAAPGEVLISVMSAHALKNLARLGNGRVVDVAGKDLELFVMPLLEVAPMARGNLQDADFPLENRDARLATQNGGRG